jgi:fumarylacetoacetate (FAA) hydrolase family protein
MFLISIILVLQLCALEDQMPRGFALLFFFFFFCQRDSEMLQLGIKHSKRLEETRKIGQSILTMSHSDTSAPTWIQKEASFLMRSLSHDHQKIINTYGWGHVNLARLN